MHSGKEKFSASDKKLVENSTVHSNLGSPLVVLKESVACDKNASNESKVINQAPSRSEKINKESHTSAEK